MLSRSYTIHFRIKAKDSRSRTRAIATIWLFSVKSMEMDMIERYKKGDIYMPGNLCQVFLFKKKVNVTFYITHKPKLVKVHVNFKMSR